MKKLLTLAVMLCVFLQVSADSWTDSNGIVWSFTVSEGKAIDVKPYNKNSIPAELVIPEKMDSYPVTSIGGSAFFDCSALTSINIPNSVTSIGEYAFFGCTGLTSLTIPDSVTIVGFYAF